MPLPPLRFARPAFLLAAALLAVLLSPRPAPAVEFPPTRNAELDFPGGAFADTVFEDVSYVSAELAAVLFGATPEWDPVAQQLRLRDPRGRTWSLTIDNPFVAVGGGLYNLTYPVRRGPERVYLPLQPFLRVLRTDMRLDLVPGAAGTPRVAAAVEGQVPGHVGAMILEETAEGSRLRVHATPGVRWQGVLARPHFIVRGLGGSLDAGVPRRLDGPGPLQSVEALQQGASAQFTLRLRGDRDSVEFTQDSTGWTALVRPPQAVATAKGTIIVDAGHGGKDPGAVVKGVREADVNLAVAKLLRTELEKRGYRVLLTREDDVFRTLQERPKFASDNNGDVFVSLHCNSISGTPSRLAQVSGFVGYILREAESEEDKAIARRENMAIEESGGKGKKTEISPLEWILLEHQLNLYSKQSESLAESIVRNFAGFEVPRYTTGARQAGFFVLVGAYMPAVLFEMGFLTNDRDRRVLASREGQREIARRLALAIDGFQSKRK